MASGGNDSLSDELECPVCLAIPREVPVSACPVGHIVCKTCRVNVTTCPTCRRLMLQDGTNTLANKMIERIPHPCKYGCQVKNYLKEIVKHEARCPERTVKCPYIGCNDQVQISKLHTHVMNKDSKCSFLAGNYEITSLQYCWEIETGSGETLERQLSKTWDWKMNAIQHNGKIFCFHQHFLSDEKTFAFYVTSEADNHLAKVTVINQNDVRKSLTITQDVISIDSAPNDNHSILASEKVMFVHWKTMSRFMKWNKETSEGKQILRSYINVHVDILVK